MGALKTDEFIRELVAISASCATTSLPLQFPHLVRTYLPLSQVIFYHKDIREESFIPFTAESKNETLPVLTEKSKIISAFSKNLEPLFLDKSEQTYLEIFDKDTDRLLTRYQTNLVVPAHFRKYFHGLLLAHVEKKNKKYLEEIAAAVRTAFGILIPRIELERLELKNDRNYYKLFKFDRLVLLGEMVASFAHEFRTPLHTIRLELKDLVDMLGNPEPLAPTLEKIEIQINRLRRLIDSLLSFSKMQDISNENFLLKPYIETLLDEIPKKRMPLALSLEISIAHDIRVISDKNRLRQVITNILFNAFDAVGQGGKIIIESYRNFQENEKKPKCILAIKDNGPGIPQEIKERIFEPFFTTKPNGTGLGLYIAYGIIKSLKGELDIESTAAGTTFFISLPGAPYG